MSETSGTYADTIQYLRNQIAEQAEQIERLKDSVKANQIENKTRAEQITELKRHRHLVDEECQGYVVLNDELQAENKQLKTHRAECQKELSELNTYCNEQAEQITALKDRLACYDATDIPETIAENKQLKEELHETKMLLDEANGYVD